MATVYQFVSPALESPEDMSLEYDGAAVQVVFYDALGAQVMLRDQAVAAYLTWYSGRIDAPFTRPPL